MSCVRTFNVNDVCVNKSTFDTGKNPKTQLLQIRKFTSNGLKALVHYTHCPAGMVIAVDKHLLRQVDTVGNSVFYRPAFACADKKRKLMSTTTTSDEMGNAEKHLRVD
jgi:hypothetical protein